MAARTCTVARAALDGVTLVLALALGVSLHAIAALLEFTSSPGADGHAQGTAAVSLAAAGPHSVGSRRGSMAEAPVQSTVWYPARHDTAVGADIKVAADDPPAAVRYSYGLSMLTPGTTVALATHPGRAVPGAEPDHKGGPYPVTELSPGFAIAATSYGWLAEHLASHGFVVAAVHHAESLDPQMLWRATVDRPRDVSAVRDMIQIESGPDGGLALAGLVDLDRVAVLGHSYGGYAALATGGARLGTRALLAACETDGHSGGALALQCDGLVPHLDELAAHAGLDAVPPGRWPSLADSRVDTVVALAGDAVMSGPDCG